MTQQIDSTEESVSKNTLDTVSDKTFAQRIQVLIATFGSITRIAKICGFSEGVVRSWRDGRSDPSRQRCLALARGLGISLVWLMSGDGNMLMDDARTRPTPIGETATGTLDAKRLSRAMRVLDSTLEGGDNELPIESRAELLGEFYAVLNDSDPATRAEGVSKIHRHLAEFIRKTRSTS